MLVSLVPQLDLMEDQELLVIKMEMEILVILPALTIHLALQMGQHTDQVLVETLQERNVQSCWTWWSSSQTWIMDMLSTSPASATQTSLSLPITSHVWQNIDLSTHSTGSGILVRNPTYYNMSL